MIPRARPTGVLLAILLTGLCGSAARASAAPPAIEATWVANVLASSANLRAEVDTGGLPTSYRFEYISAAAYRENLEAAPPRDPFAGASRIPLADAVLATGSGVAVVQHLGGLRAASAYRFRLHLENSDGALDGPPRRLLTDQLAPVFALPDSRAWEMVSPADKNGGEIEGFGAGFGGGVLQAGAQGGVITYSSRASFANAAGAPPASQYLSSRAPLAWSTENISLPTESGAYGDYPEGVPYQLFSPSLDRAVLSEGRTCAQPDCPLALALRGPGRTLTELPAHQPDLRLRGSTPSLSHLVISTCAALSADATAVPAPGGGCDPLQPNLYEYSGASELRLLNLLPGAALGTPGARLAAPAGAISEDGSRVYWSEAGDLYLREGSETHLLAANADFQGASRDGSIAYYTSESHLYRYLASTGISTDLTPAAGVQGMLGTSADGEYVYYVDAAGLELFHAGATTAIAPAPAPSSYPPATGTAHLTDDGRHLAFLSSAPSPEYENRGVLEAYLYAAPAGAGPGTLVCASCDPSGEPPLGPAALPGASPNGSSPEAFAAYKPRVLAPDGSRLFFDSYDSLVPQDTNGDRDVYEWRPPGVAGCSTSEGCIGLISSGRSAGGATFIDASLEGTDAFFITDGSLVASDPGSADLYDARVGGGFPESAQPIPCLGDACQPLPPEPEDAIPATLRTGLAGNPPLSFTRPGRGRHHRHRKHHRDHRHKQRHKHGGSSR
jgi:hypothetical protein